MQKDEERCRVWQWEIRMIGWCLKGSRAKKAWCSEGKRNEIMHIVIMYTYGSYGSFRHCILDVRTMQSL